MSHVTKGLPQQMRSSTSAVNMDLQKSVMPHTLRMLKSLLSIRQNSNGPPPASFRDFCHYFGQWKNRKILFGTAASWFVLDVAFVRDSDIRATQTSSETSETSERERRKLQKLWSVLIGPEEFSKFPAARTVKNLGNFENFGNGGNFLAPPPHFILKFSMSS